MQNSNFDNVSRNVGRVYFIFETKTKSHRKLTKKKGFQQRHAKLSVATLFLVFFLRLLVLVS